MIADGVQHAMNVRWWIKNQPKVLLPPLFLIEVPFEKIGMDIDGPLEWTAWGHHFVLVLVDYAMWYPEAEALCNVTFSARSIVQGTSLMPCTTKSKRCGSIHPGPIWSPPLTIPENTGCQVARELFIHVFTSTWSHRHENLWFRMNSRLSLTWE